MEELLHVFFLLLESIFIYGNIDDQTKILVYTTTHIMETIKQSHLYNEIIVFEINDIDKQYNKPQLDVFCLPSIVNYNTILYLDNHTIIKNDLHKLFNSCKKDILYLLEEEWGELNLEKKHALLLEDSVDEYEDKIVSTSNVLLFNNCDKIKDIFIQLKKSLLENILYDNKKLRLFAVNNNSNKYSQYVIHHFRTGSGVYKNKVEAMTDFFKDIKDYTIYIQIEKTKEFVLNHLIQIIHDSGEPLEENIFTFHNSKVFTDIFINKQKNMSSLILNKNIKNVFEIGFYAGFSALLILFSNKNIKLTCFDSEKHLYTIPCYNKIKEFFGDRIELIVGDTSTILPTINGKYDLIHIDGDRLSINAEINIVQSYRLSKKGTILMMDDYDFVNIHELWDQYCKEYNLKSPSTHLYLSFHHNIRYVP